MLQRYKCSKLLCFTLTCFFTLIFIKSTNAQQPAFPGAEGAGMYASGGRGTLEQPTTVFEVTSLADDNVAGTLRYACARSVALAPYRTIVFRVSGTIHLTSRLTIPANTTIAGQTAPGDGICLADYPVAINGNNVIVRYIRFRMGDKNQLKTTPAGCGVPVAPFTAACMPLDGSGGDDAFGDLGHKNLIIDHCTVSWSTDEALTVYRGDSVTMQWNFITEPLNYSYHFETGDADFEHHGYGGIWGSQHGSFHHNLFAHCQSRNPRFGGNNTYAAGVIESADFRNNVIYDWGLYTVYGGEGGQYNLVNNYYKYGPATGSATRYRIVNVDSNAAFGHAKYYLSGNYVDGSVTNTNNNWLGAFMIGGNAADTIKSKVTTPFLSNYPQISTQTASDAFEAVLNSAGAILPRRDTLDRRIVNDVRFRTGRHIDVQGGYPHATPYAQTVNAWPTLNSTTAPADADQDGMPDSWETANSLNPNDASDRQNVAANGYTNLENYLNSITNTSPEIYFSGVLNNFSQTSATPSAVQTVTVSGVNLTGNVTITPPAGYEVSLNGTNWFTNANPLILTPAGGSIANTSLSVRLNTATAGTYNGNIVSSTPGVNDFFLNVSGSRASAPASGPVTATWPLLTNDAPTLSAATVTATNQTLGSAIAGTSYNSTFGTVGGWQRSATTTNLPVGYNANAYVEYTVTPASGQTLTISSLSLGALGGGTGLAKMAIYYSLDNFTTSAPVGTVSYNNTTYPATTASPIDLLNTSTSPLTGQQIASASTNITVQPLQTLSLRLYVWAGSTGRYFASQNVTLNGSTTAQVLPLKLLGFSGRLENGNAKLLWNTQNQVNVKGFEIERSADGKNFSPAGFVNATNSGSYTFSDLSTVNGSNYYRIKMIDEDGSYSYSSIVVINTKLNNLFTVFPNPASGTITITHPVATSKIQLYFHNAAGKLVKTVNLQQGATQTNVEIQALPKGNYFITISDAKKTIMFSKQ